MRINRFMAAAAALSIVAVPATAHAAAKKGVWIATVADNQIYLQTTPSKIKILQFGCISPTGSVTNALVKNVKISSNGKASKKATATLTGQFSTTKAPVTVKVSFSSKAKGSITATGCNPIKFSAKYLGKNPKG